MALRALALRLRKPSHTGTPTTSSTNSHGSAPAMVMTMLWILPVKLSQLRRQVCCQSRRNLSNCSVS